MLLDTLLALWFASLLVVGAYMYFRGAKKQLEKCLRLRHCEWMDDKRWEREADIGRSRKR